jgi:uncharacterized membrane protein YfcA
VDGVLKVAVGFFSGILSGAFGIGGGLITTPAIALLLGYPALIAVGTPLPVILPGALTGAFTYWKRGSADVRAGVVMGLAGAVPAVAGALLSQRAGGTVVLLATAALIGWASADMLLQHRSASRADAVPGAGESDEAVAPAVDRSAAGSGRGRAVRLVIIGAIAGVYSGFFGLGGGFVIVPGLTRYLGMPVKRAIGTSLVVVAMLVIPGTIAHGFLVTPSHVDWTLALMLAIGVVPGALVGARLTHRSSDRVVRLAFALLLAAVGVLLAASELGGLAR